MPAPSVNRVSTGPHRAVVIGPVNADLFIRGHAPLDPNVLNSWVGPADIDLLVAGSIGYTIQALNRLGLHVEVCTTFGEDAFGVHLRRAVEQAGIGTSLSRSTPGDTAIAIYMLLFGGTKRPMTYRLPTFEPWPDPVPLDRLDDVSVVLCGGLLHFPNMWHRSLASVFERARAAGVMTALDPQFPLTDMPAPWLPHLADVLPHVDVFLCDESESRSIFGTSDPETALRMAIRSGPHVVAVKLGARGALVTDGHELVMQPAVPMPTDLVRESVGAGDAFDAGFLTSLLNGASAAEAARFGTAVAALTLAGRGGAERIDGPQSVAAEVARVPAATTRPLVDDPLHHP
jgi:sugar/nucleoside kinase (ribokinase family)